MSRQRIFLEWRLALVGAFYRQRRGDQWLLLVCGGCVLACLLYLLLLTPLKERVRLAQGQTQALQLTLAQVQQLSAELKALPRQPKTAEQAPLTNLAELVDRSLRSHGLIMRGFQPGEEGHAQLRLEKVAYSSLLRWLYDLEVRHRLVIKELSLVKSSTPGIVTANIRLQKHQ